MWWIYIDAFYYAFIARQQCLQCLQIISMNNHVFTAVVFRMHPFLIIAVTSRQHAKRNLLMIIYNFIFPHQFKRWHSVSLPYIYLRLTISNRTNSDKMSELIYLQNISQLCILPLQFKAISGKI